MSDLIGNEINLSKFTRNSEDEMDLGSHNEWSEINLHSEPFLDTRNDNSKSTISQCKATKTKSIGISSLLASIKGSVSSHQAQTQSNYDIRKLAQLSETMLNELNNGLTIMLQAANRFRSISSGPIGTIDKLKIILYHSIKNLNPSKEEFKCVERKLRKNIKGVEELVSEICGHLINKSIIARIGSNLYDEMIRENLDKFNIEKSVNIEFKPLESEVELQQSERSISSKPMDEFATQQAVNLELKAGTGELIIRSLHGQSVAFCQLKLQQKVMIVNAILEEIKKLAEQSLTDLRQLEIYFKPFKSTGKTFGKTLAKQHLPVVVGHSMEAHIYQIREQFELKPNSGSLSHNLIEASFSDHLNAMPGLIQTFISINETVGSYFREQVEELGEIKKACGKILNGKKHKFNWAYRKEDVEIKLFSLGSTTFLLGASPDCDIASTSCDHENGGSLVLNIEESVESIPDFPEPDQAKNPGWLERTFNRVLDTISSK